MHVLDGDDRLHLEELIFMDGVRNTVKEHHNFMAAAHGISYHLRSQKAKSCLSGLSPFVLPQATQSPGFKRRSSARAKFFRGVGRQLSANSRYYDFGELDFTFDSFHFLTPCVYVNFR